MMHDAERVYECNPELDSTLLQGAKSILLNDMPVLLFEASDLPLA